MSSLQRTDPIRTMVQEILGAIGPDDMHRLVEEQRKVRKACKAMIRTLNVQNPEQLRQLRSYVHMAKTDTLLQELREPGTLSNKDLAKNVYVQFLTLLDNSPFRQHESMVC